MVKELPEIEDSHLTQYIKPKGNYVQFKDEEEMVAKTREWGLNTKTSKKKEFWYKQKFYKRVIEVDGYQVEGKTEIAVIKFKDGNLSSILPVYLKEMQAKGFGDIAQSEEGIEEKVTEKKKAVKKTKKEQEKKEKEDKELEEHQEELGKVLNTKVAIKMEVEKFDTVYNYFADKEEPIVIFKDIVVTTDDGEIPINNVWCSLSKTIEKLELEEGSKLDCVGTIVANNTKKGILYKVNRPSKLKKS